MAPARTLPPPVLIVGTGPVGLFQAYALAKLDVPSIIIGRHKERLGAPKAHALSPRSLEICRQFGISVDEIRKHPAFREDAKWVRFCTNLSGQAVGHLPYERMSLDVLDVSPEMLHNIAQPDFEDMVDKLIEKEPHVDVRKGWTWMSCTESTRDGQPIVVSVVQNTYTGETTTIESSVLIGCDGANSRVRKNVGIESEGEETAETMMTIHFSADLRPVVKENVGMLHWIMDPEARGFIIAYDLSGNQVLIHNFDSNYHPLESFTDEKCLKIVKAAIGDDAVPVKLHSTLPWILRRQVANEYYRGRVMLAGDSAHSFPPTGGLGLNSGLGDAHNLAFKIAAVHHGWASLPTVLASYDEERRPVALRNSTQSVINGVKIFALLKALKNTGPDPVVARREMMEALANPEQAALISKLIEGQVEHFDNLMLHIGYVYEPNWNPANATDFVPAYRKGARLAHAWIKPATNCVESLPEVDLSYLAGDLAEDKVAQWNYSTLDLVPAASYALLYAKDTAWASKAADLKAQLAARHIPVVLVEHGVDFEFVDAAAGQAWLDGFGLDKGNAILVRPDQHIAVVTDAAQPVDELVKEALATLQV